MNESKSVGADGGRRGARLVHGITLDRRIALDQGITLGRRIALTRGFTLIEVLAVVSIMAILMSLMIVGAGLSRNKAYRKASHAIVMNVKSALEEYKAAHGRYPPDGYDKPVFRTVGGRAQIRGAQCLLYFLGLPTTRMAEYGDDVQEIELSPFLDVTIDMITGNDNEELVNMLKRVDARIIDRYGNPLVYDNTRKDKNGRVRLSIQSNGGPDWRSANGGRARYPGTYDLYSRGQEADDVTDDIWADD